MEIIFIGALLYLGRDQCSLFSYPSRKRGDVVINVGRSSPKVSVSVVRFEIKLYVVDRFE